MIHWAICGGIAEVCLRYGDVCGVLGIVKRLDMEGGGRVARGRSGRHDGARLKGRRRARILNIATKLNIHVQTRLITWMVGWVTGS